MRIWLLAFVYFAVADFASGAPVEEDWQAVWADEFEGTGHPDPEKWGYESGFVRNNEKQFYTTKRLKNARVENGCLVIEGHRESPVAADLTKEPAKKLPKIQYTSASLHTKGLASWKFGRIEVRYHSFRSAKAKSPGGNPFHKPHYLILNLALGGNWGGKIDNSIFPARFLVDYVRVYRKK
jgi:beta-glucanase (GH16 family)